MNSYNSKPKQQVNTASDDSNIILKPRIRCIIARQFPMILLAIAMPIINSYMSDTYGRQLMYGLGLLLVLYLTFELFQIKHTTWIINESQLIYKRGVFAIKTDYMELYRVNDYKEEQSLAQRLIGLKKVVVFTTDRTMPVLNLFGIDNEVDVISYLRENVEQSKKERRIYEIANY